MLCTGVPQISICGESGGTSCFYDLAEWYRHRNLVAEREYGAFLIWCASHGLCLCALHNEIMWYTRNMAQILWLPKKKRLRKEKNTDFLYKNLHMQKKNSIFAPELWQQLL